MFFAVLPVVLVVAAWLCILVSLVFGGSAVLLWVAYVLLIPAMAQVMHVAADAWKVKARIVQLESELATLYAVLRVP